MTVSLHQARQTCSPLASITDAPEGALSFADAGYLAIAYQDILHCRLGIDGIMNRAIANDDCVVHKAPFRCKNGKKVLPDLAIC